MYNAYQRNNLNLSDRRRAQLQSLLDAARAARNDYNNYPTIACEPVCAAERTCNIGRAVRREFAYDNDVSECNSNYKHRLLCEDGNLRDNNPNPRRVNCYDACEDDYDMDYGCGCEVYEGVARRRACAVPFVNEIVDPCYGNDFYDDDEVSILPIDCLEDTASYNVPEPRMLHLKAWSYDPALTFTHTALTNHVLHLSAIEINHTTMVHAIVLHVHTEVVGNGNGYAYAGIYTKHGKLIVETENVDNCLRRKGEATLPLEHCITLHPGMYYVGILTDSTVPAVIATCPANMETETCPLLYADVVGNFSDLPHNIFHDGLAIAGSEHPIWTALK